MKTRTRIARLLGHLLYWAGAVLGTALLVGSVWADIEAMFYGFEKMGDKAVRTLNCPLLITPAGAPEITARFSNPTDREVQQLLRMDVSGPLIKSEQTRITLAPGESRRVGWAVNWDEMAYGRFVLAKVSAYPAYPFPFRESSCGIVAVNLPYLAGGQLTALTVGLTFLFMLAGLFLLPDRDLLLGKRVLHASWARIVLAALLLAGLAFSLLNLPFLAALLLLLSVLTALSMLYLIVL
jgi:hypothetical protein